MLELTIKTAISYLLGSIVGSLVVGKLYGGVDIRKAGSGNPGGTNALRTQGKTFAALVMLIDVGKGVVCAGVIPALSLPGLAANPDVSRQWIAVACAAAAVVGHVYPLWHGFAGGKGAATLLGAGSVLMPSAIVPVMLVWILTLMITGYVGLASIFAAAAFPLHAVLFATPGAKLSLIALGLGMAALLLFTHRSNIARIRNGTEHRFESAMLVKRLH